MWSNLQRNRRGLTHAVWAAAALMVLAFASCLPALAVEPCHGTSHGAGDVHAAQAAAAPLSARVVTADRHEVERAGLQPDMHQPLLATVSDASRMSGGSVLPCHSAAGTSSCCCPAAQMILAGLLPALAPPWRAAAMHAQIATMLLSLALAPPVPPPRVRLVA